MGLCRSIFHSLILATTSYTAAEAIEPALSASGRFKVMHLAAHADATTPAAFHEELLCAYTEQRYDAIHLAALTWLQSETRCGTAERERLALLCAGLTEDEKVLPLFETALTSSDPNKLLLGLQTLCRYHNSLAEKALATAMRSPYLEVRYMAATWLAEGRYPSALDHIEGLASKCTADGQGLFAPLYATLATPAAEHCLKRLLVHPKASVRRQAILSIAENSYESLAAPIRTLATHLDLAEQEACAYALGKLHDQASLPLLRKLAQAPYPHVALAAQVALYRLGEGCYTAAIIARAEKGDLFAIQQLKNIESATDTLAQLTKHSAPLVRLNAMSALLHQGDIRAARPLCEWLFKDTGTCFVKKYSAGETLYAYTAIPQHPKRSSKIDEALSEWLSFQQEWLSQAQKLPEDAFLNLAQAIVNTPCQALIPPLFKLLAEAPSEACEEFLQKNSQKVGSPLVRLYSHLALLEQGHPIPARQHLESWIQAHWKEPLLTDSHSQKNTATTDVYTLQPQERTTLLLAALEALSNINDTETTRWLLQGFCHAHPQLRSAFAALLIRCLQ